MQEIKKTTTTKTKTRKPQDLKGCRENEDPRKLRLKDIRPEIGDPIFII